MKNWTKMSVIAWSLTACQYLPAAPVAQKHAPAETPHYTRGTDQMAGASAKLGVTYTLGVARPMNITLLSAEYSLEPMLVGQRLYTVDSSHKMLILHMTYQNPVPREQSVRWDTYEYTAVDAADQNSKGLAELASELDSTPVIAHMKPGQKMAVRALMMVPAVGEIPKLIIKASDGLVLRYDLTGKVKPLAAPYASAADKSGASAADKIEAPIGSTIPVGCFSG